MNLNQIPKQAKSASPVQSQPERDLDNYRELQMLAIQKLEQQMKKQVSEGADCRATHAEKSLQGVEWFLCVAGQEMGVEVAGHKSPTRV